MHRGDLAVFRVLQDLLGETCEIRRGRVLAGAVVAAGIDEVRVFQTERRRALVHAPDEGRPAVVRERPAGIVGRMHDGCGQELARTQLLAGAQADAAAALAGGGTAHHHRLVELAALQHQERGHHLGKAGRCVPLVLARGPQHAAVALHDVRVGDPREAVFDRPRGHGREQHGDEHTAR